MDDGGPPGRLGQGGGRMTWQDDARAALDSILVLYEGKDAAKNEQRRRRKAQAIEWHVSEIEKGW